MPLLFFNDSSKLIKSCLDLKIFSYFIMYRDLQIDSCFCFSNIFAFATEIHQA